MIEFEGCGKSQTRGRAAELTKLIISNPQVPTRERRIKIEVSLPQMSSPVSQAGAGLSACRKMLALGLLLSLCQVCVHSTSDTSFHVLQRANAVHRLPPSSLHFHPSSSSQQQQPQQPKSSKVAKRDLNSGVRRTASGKACQVNNGESVAILEIEESRGSETSQTTNPIELPIGGSLELGEIELKIESETHKYFEITGEKRLKLTRPLDRDATLKENSTQISQQPISSIYLQISCIDRRRPVSTSNGSSVALKSLTRKVIIPVLVKVLDLNDNAPRFATPNYQVQVDELAPLGTIVVGPAEQLFAIDLDSANNGQIEYSLRGTVANPSAQNSASRLPNQRLLERTLSSQTQPARQTTGDNQQATTTASFGSTNQFYTTTMATPKSVSANSATAEAASFGPAELSAAKVAPAGGSSSSSSSSRSPTINMDSEPIMNGPMEELEGEEESDEALLASMNNNNTGNNSTDSSGEQDAASALRSSSGGLKRRRRKRRHSMTTGYLTTLAANVATDSMTTTTTAARSTTTASGGQRSEPLWTNLMNSGEDLSSGDLQAATGGGGSHQTRNHESAAATTASDFFSLEFAPQSGRPMIKLKRKLDYETQRVHTLVLEATDRAANKADRLAASTTITIRVLDGDDQPPAFVLDQSGCATGSLPQTTTELYNSLGSSSSSSTGTASEPIHVSAATAAGQTASSPSEMATPNQRFGANVGGNFRASEDNFDFGDTLALDDTPLDQEPQTVRARRIVPSHSADQQVAGNTPTARPRLAAEYLCLTRAVAALGGGSNSQAEYFASVTSGDSDYVLRVAPQSIKARDRDELNAPIRYSFVNGTPANYSHYFQINPLDGTIKQVAPLESTRNNGGDSIGGGERGQQFVLWIQAQEQSVQKLASLAKLTIDVVPSEKNPPLLTPNSYSGFVEENSPIGTRVLVNPPPSAQREQLPLEQQQQQQQPIYLRIGVVDADTPTSSSGGRSIRVDLSASPTVDGQQRQQSQSQMIGPQAAQYEFETTSDAFKVDRDGFVYVNRWPLDRDPPAQATHMFQVTARQLGLAALSSHSLSSPVSLNVTLLDLNDNPPQLLNHTLTPIQLAANTRGGSLQLTQIRALDKDLAPENTRMRFSIQHVSNGGRERFRMDEETGVIEAVGKFQAGEQFSLTVQVADDLNRQSQGILEVSVVPGANTGGPQFISSSMGGETLTLHSPAAAAAAAAAATSMVLAAVPPSSSIHNHHNFQRQFSEEVEVSEDVAVNSVVLQLHAIDPENDPISYSLVDGNVNNDFSINSKTGALSVAKRLDREEISAYNLLVQARDSGGLATSRHVRILVADSNDQNPQFSQHHYVFSINEGVANVPLGRVVATDGDLGDNGRISYSLEVLDEGNNSGSKQVAADGKGQLFAIDQQTGELRLVGPLDYEARASHTLLVVARDGGEHPRSSSASVQVRVLDVQDEVPHFERPHLEVRIEENAANARVALVQARDPDSAADISYLLLEGDVNLFRVDPISGLVSTTGRGLDYEQAKRHTLIVGTKQAEGTYKLASVLRQIQEFLVNGGTIQSGEQVAGQASSGQTPNKWPVVRIDVLVGDLNDNAPQFGVSQQMPIRVQDSVQLGTVLTRLRAIDADGSAPNNQIYYELVTVDSTSSGSGELSTSEKCAHLFMVQPTSGNVSVRADLRQDARSECHLVVRARDLPSGDADAKQAGSLSSTTSLTVFIDHLAEIISPTSLIAFADSKFTVELSENAAANTLVKVLPVVNKPRGSAFPLSCEIVSGNELGRFFVMQNEQLDCELRTRDNLIDFELRQRFNLMVKLNTIGGGGGGSLLAGPLMTVGGSSTRRQQVAQVQVNILDQNDNRPIFVAPPARYNQLSQNKHLAAIASDAPPDTQVIQLRAFDADLSYGTNGLVSYELLNAVELEGRFKVDAQDGIVRTSRPMEDVPPGWQPIKLKLIARDNPEQVAETLDSLAEVVVNLVDDRHRIALVFRDTPASRLLENKDELLGIIQERTGLISGLERVESLKWQRNNTAIESDVSGTDVWFHLVEPGTLRLVASDDSRVKAALFDGRAQNSLLDVIAHTFAFPRAKVRLPFALSQSAAASLSSRLSLFSFDQMSRTIDSNNRLAPILIMIALFIAVTSAIVVIYQCGSAAGFSLANSAANGYPSGCHQMALPANFNSKDLKQQHQLFFGPQFGAATFNSQFGGNSIQDSFAFRPTLNGVNCRQSMDSAMQQVGGLANTNNAFAAADAKEYETQMLKMSVLFDDGHSVDEHNMAAHDQNVARNAPI